MTRFCTALAFLISATAAAGETAQPIWELRPYRIQIFLGFADRPELGGELPSRLAGRLAEGIPSLQGGAWNVTVAPAPEALRQAMSASLDDITAEVLPRESLAADKVVLVHVSAASVGRNKLAQFRQAHGPTLADSWASGGGYQVAAREFDVATGLWGPPVVRPVEQLLKLSEACSTAIFEAFAPLARLSAVKDRQVVLRLRASALKPRDAALVPVRRGSVFRLAARAISAEGAAAPKATSIPWTFCVVEEVAQDELRGRLESGLQDPLPDRWETSLEVLALGAAPPRRPTVLTLKAADKPSQPLPGYDIYAASPDAASPVFLGRTDRQGSLAVPPADHPLRIVLVRHGDQWLARLPMVPGLEPELSVTVVHSGHRVELEGRIAVLRDALIDLAARRRMLLARVKARMADKQFAEAEKAIAQWRELPSPEDLAARRLAEAKKDLSGDAAAVARLEAVAADFQQALAAQADAKEIDDLAAEIQQHKPAPEAASGGK